MQIIEGGVTAAKGFKAAGMAAGIKYKNGKKDMAMVVSDKPCVTAGTFTLNRVFAPLLLNGIRILYIMKLMHRQL